MYVNELKQAVKKMAKETGNHKQWCATQIAKTADFQRFAEETQNRRHLSAAHMATTGTNRRTGEPVSAKEQAEARSDMIQSIAAWIAA